MTEVTASEAKAHKLPAVGFRVDSPGLELSKFPEPEIYLIGSGPPGGPLAAIVWSVLASAGDAGALEKAVRGRHSEAWQQPLVIGEAATVTIGGEDRPALAFMTGTSLRKTAWCGVLVGGPQGSVFITLGRSPGQAASMSCAEVLAQPSLAAFARTFALL